MTLRDLITKAVNISSLDTYLLNFPDLDFEINLNVVGEYGSHDQFKVESADINRKHGTITLWSN